MRMASCAPRWSENSSLSTRWSTHSRYSCPKWVCRMVFLNQEMRWLENVVFPSPKMMNPSLCCWLWSRRLELVTMGQALEAALKNQCNLRNTLIAQIRWNLILVKTKMTTCRIMIIHHLQQAYKAAQVKMSPGKTPGIRSRSSRSKPTTFKNQERDNHLRIQIPANKRQKRIKASQWPASTTFLIYKVAKSNKINNEMMIMILADLMTLAMTTVTKMSNNKIIAGFQTRKSIWMIWKMRRGKVSKLKSRDPTLKNKTQLRLAARRRSNLVTNLDIIKVTMMRTRWLKKTFRRREMKWMIIRLNHPLVTRPVSLWVSPWVSIPVLIVLPLMNMITLRLSKFEIQYFQTLNFQLISYFQFKN